MYSGVTGHHSKLLDRRGDRWEFPAGEMAPFAPGHNRYWSSCNRRFDIRCPPSEYECDAAKFLFFRRSAAEISERIRNFRSFRPTLGIIFSSVSLDIPGLAQLSLLAGFPSLAVLLPGRSSRRKMKTWFLNNRQYAACSISIRPFFPRSCSRKAMIHPLTSAGGSVPG